MTDPDLRAALERLIVQWDKSADMHADLYQKAVDRRDTVNSDRQEAYAYAAQLHAKQLREILAVVRAPQPPCKTCDGRGWVMKNEGGYYENGLGWGTSTNVPCPDCVSLRPPSSEQTR